MMKQDDVLRQNIAHLLIQTNDSPQNVFGT